MTILLEDMRGQIKLVVDGHRGLERSIEDTRGEIRQLEKNIKRDIGNICERMDGMEGKIDSMEGRMGSMEGKMDQMGGQIDRMETDISDLKSGQSQILEYLSRIEEELQSLKKDLNENYETKGQSKKWRDSIEGRLEKIEKALTQKTFSAGMIRDGR